MNDFKLGKAGADLIKSFEGLELIPYLCPAGVLTVGWGHTGPDIVAGEKITFDHAASLFNKDIQNFVLAVNSAVKVSITQNEFDALVSFAYNVGIGAFRNSTLLRKLNANDHIGAANQFKVWIKGGGKALPGLVRRRTAEKQLFETRA